MMSIWKRISIAWDVITGKTWSSRTEETEYDNGIHTETAVYWVEDAWYTPRSHEGARKLYGR